MFKKKYITITPEELSDIYNTELIKALFRESSVSGYFNNTAVILIYCTICWWIAVLVGISITF